jgi:hypothetical protein
MKRFTHERQIEAATASGFRDAAMQKPRGVVLATQSAMELMSGKAFLGRCSKPERHGPLREFGVRAFHHAAGQDRKIFAALFVRAAVTANLLGVVVFRRLAVRAHRLVVPTRRLEPNTGRFLVVKLGFCKDVLSRRLSP